MERGQRRGGKDEGGERAVRAEAAKGKAGEHSAAGGDGRHRWQLDHGGENAGWRVARTR